MEILSCTSSHPSSSFVASDSERCSAGSGKARISSPSRKSFQEPKPEIGTDLEGRLLDKVVDMDNFPSEFCWDDIYDLRDPYAELLDYFGVSDEDRKCDFHGYVEYSHSTSRNFDCPVETIYKPVLNVGKYHPQRSRQHHARSSDRAYDRFLHIKELARKQRVKFDYLRFIDITIPKSVSEKLPDDVFVDEFRGAVRDFFHRLEDELYRGQQLVGMRTIHVWSSESPLTPHLHAHTVISNVVYDRGSERWDPHPSGSDDRILRHLGGFHRVDPFIDERRLKEIWRSVLVDHGWWDPDDDDLPVVYIEVIKFWDDVDSPSDEDLASSDYSELVKRRLRDTHMIRHKLSYMARCPIEDLNENLEDSDLGDLDEDFAWFVLNYTTSRSNLGFASDLKRSGYDSNSSLDPLCPICGAPLYKIRRVYENLADKVHLFRRNEGSWVERPPPKNFEGGE